MAKLIYYKFIYNISATSETKLHTALWGAVLGVFPGDHQSTSSFPAPCQPWRRSTHFHHRSGQRASCACECRRSSRGTGCLWNLRQNQHISIDYIYIDTYIHTYIYIHTHNLVPKRSKLITNIHPLYFRQPPLWSWPFCMLCVHTPDGCWLEKARYNYLA